MHLERRRAAAKGYPSPIWDTLEVTHRNYDSCVDVILDEVKRVGNIQKKIWARQHVDA
jgi:proline dehydrogenase